MATRVEELRESVLDVREHLPPDLERQLLKDLDSLISAAKAEEGERIRSGSKYIDCSNEEDTVDLSFWHVPATILTPKEVV